MESEIIKSHPSLQRAIDIALWMNFKYRLDKRRYGVIQDKKAHWYQVVETKGKRKSSLIDLPAGYSEMTYEQIEAIRTIVNPLHHWEEIVGLFSTAHGEILRFILASEIPLEKLIRYELAIRGYDENHLWVGFEKSSSIWLK
ncbi:hypothetical protein [Flavobacterium sp.]|uniref:hypothetical protein n=1 Tax=Flavobacterium sp. TaxID=239 RepID=UPI00261E910D|nr:hypothetical protein [Flavobacterium sp.]MDD2987126.1 hypothetical protein [Flavobacterium sp.]